MTVFMFASEGVYGMSNFGKLQTDFFDVLAEKDSVTKKNFNVMNSMDNLLVEGHEITSVQFDIKERKFIINLKDELWSPESNTSKVED